MSIKGDSPKERGTMSLRLSQSKGNATHWFKANRSLLLDIGVVAALLLMVLALFARVILTPGQAASPMRGDFAIVYAIETVVRHALAHSELPLWNPYFAGGNPGLADPASQVFYPPTLLLRYLPLSIADAFTWSGLLHLWLAGVGVFLLICALGCVFARRHD
jgi:hypothetical protein